MWYTLFIVNREATPKRRPETMIVLSTVTPQRVADLIINAIESGIRYWCDDVKVFKPDGGRVTYADIACGDDQPDFTGHRLVFVETDTHEEHTLDLTNDSKQVESALGLMLSGKYPMRHITNILHENDDAETADVFVQLCLFGDIVYG